MTTFFAGLLAGLMLDEFVKFAQRVYVTRRVLDLILSTEWRSLESIIERLELTDRFHLGAFSICLFLLHLHGEVERKGVAGTNSMYRLTDKVWS